MAEEKTKQPEKGIIYVPIPETNQDDEMDLFELWNVIWKGKWFMIGFILLSTLCAAYITLNILPVLYKSEAVLQPTTTKDASGLSVLTANLPINVPLGVLGDKNASISLFLKSRTIKERLIKKYNLIPKLYSDKWDEIHKKWVVDDEEDIPTLQQATEMIKRIYRASEDKKTGLISITWIDRSPEFTYQMLERVIKELRYYLENEYDSDSKREREFIEKQMIKSEKELVYWETQVPSKKVTLSKIQRERMASQTVYTELRKQLELAKISEVKEIVNFKILDAPYIPDEEFKPKKILICSLTMISSCFLSILFLLLYNFVRHINLEKKRRTMAQETTSGKKL